MRVLVIGDSIAYGAWDTEAGWVDRIKRIAHQDTVQTEGKTKLQIINLGIGGDTSTKILKRMSAEIEARHSTGWPFVFMMAFGSNDQRSIDGKVEVPMELFRTNVQAIVDIARQHSEKILFLGIPPLGKPFLDFKGQEYSDERIKQYDAILQGIVEAADIPYLPLRGAFENERENLYSFDFLHPNDKGHQLIARLVEPELQKLLAP